MEALGPQFFFNVETGDLATEWVEAPITTDYPVYLWDENAERLLLHEPDGSITPADTPTPETASAAPEKVGPPDFTHMAVERMDEVMGEPGLLVDDDQPHWVDVHLQSLAEPLNDKWLRVFTSWLGEYIIRNTLNGKWVEQDGRWFVHTGLQGDDLFDPESVVLETVGSADRGEHAVLMNATNAAPGLPPRI